MTGRPPEGADAVEPWAFDEMLSEAITFELTNWGFLGALLREQAAEEGLSVEAYIAESLEEMRESLEPMDEDSPNAAILAAVSAMLDDPDRPGVLRFVLTTDEPRPFDELSELIASG